MNNQIKVGVGVLIIQDNKVLLGHRVENYKDTGGIHEENSWTCPGGKQEYNETFIECAIRETKEETNLDVETIEVFNVHDDISTDRHFITIQVIARNFSGELKAMEPEKIDKWEWFDLDNLPENLYTPSKNEIEAYKKYLNK